MSSGPGGIVTVTLQARSKLRVARSSGGEHRFPPLRHRIGSDDPQRRSGSPRWPRRRSPRIRSAIPILVFRSKRADRVKLLRIGLMLISKRLSFGAPRGKRVASRGQCWKPGLSSRQIFAIGVTN